MAWTILTSLGAGLPVIIRLIMYSFGFANEPFSIKEFAYWGLALNIVNLRVSLEISKRERRFSAQLYSGIALGLLIVLTVIIHGFEVYSDAGSVDLGCGITTIIVTLGSMYFGYEITCESKE